MAARQGKRSRTFSAAESQLIVYHFMFGPDWKEGCPSCSFISDHIDASVVHLAARDVRLTVVSRAPLAQDRSLQEAHGMALSLGFIEFHRLQLRLPGVHDQRRASEGRSLLQLLNAEVSKRGTARHQRVLQGCHRQHLPHLFKLRPRLDILIGAYNWLDLAPKGRDEEGLKHGMAWVRHHDKYDAGYKVDAQAEYVQPAKTTDAAAGCCANH